MKPIPVHNRHLISIQRPSLWIASLIAVVVCVILLVASSFEYGRQVAGFIQSDYDEQVVLLQSKIVELTTQNENLQRKNAKLIRDHSIDKDAGGQVTQELAKAQAQILEMREELTFYRNIVQPNKASRTVVIKKVQLMPDSGNEYKYKVVLIQQGRHDAAVRGNVELLFEGRKPDGQLVSLDLPTVATKKVSKRQRFGFKYFQNFEGGIRIPDDFVPLSMYIRVLPSSSRVPKIEKKFAWDDITSGGEQSNVGQTEN